MNLSLLSQDPTPKLFRDLQVEPEEARSILRPQKDPIYGHGFTLNPYRGCSHGCRYCYVRDYPAPAKGHDPAHGQPVLHDAADWGRWVAPKLNAPEMLWSQRHRLHNEAVFMSSATDPYQPIEKDFRLTRKCLQVLQACPTTRVMLHTRSPMILQDLNLIQMFGDRISIGFSIPTDDDIVRQIVEPNAPSISSRWATVERLAKAGISVGISAAPLMPICDVEAFGRRARDSGAQSAWAGGLRLLRDDPFYAILAEHHWLHILDFTYTERVRSALREYLPTRPRVHRSTRSMRSMPSMPSMRLVPEPVWAKSSGPTRPPSHSLQAARQPGLFEAAS